MILVIFNTAVRERQRVEQPLLGGPAATPPKQIDPTHGLLVTIGFQALLGESASP
jgi:hypothetical protein